MTVITPEIQAEIEIRAKITGHRLGVLAHAREVLDRAKSETLAWRGRPVPGVISAMAVLDATLQSWDSVRTEADKHQAIRKTDAAASQVVSVIEADMCWESAFYVAQGEEWWEQ